MPEMELLVGEIPEVKFQAIRAGERIVARIRWHGGVPGE
jgi:hypothetical protein